MSRENDEMEDSLYEDHLFPPERLSGLVNSPTTDTLDSVALETSPTEEQDLLGVVSLPAEQGQTGGEGTSETTTDDDKDIGISFDTPDISIDLNSSVIPSASQAEVLCSDPLQSKAETEHAMAFENVSSVYSINRQLQGAQSISSYFSGQAGKDDIFDSIGKGGGDSDGSRHSAFDEIINTELALDQVNPQSSKDASPEVEEYQPLSPELREEVLEVNDTQTDVTHICHREHKMSTSEPETVSFEGVQMDPGEDAGNISDLTVSEKDEFESFTAAEGSDVIQHTGLVERSDSLPHDSLVTSPSSLGQQQQQPTVQRIVEEAGSLVYGLTMQGPSVGTTPTNMSPLHTPSHNCQPLTSQINPSEALKFDKQSSVPTSPFHSADSGPQSVSFPSFGEVGVGDDIFTASLTVSDADRRFDAWIPSDATRHILINMATSPGTYSPTVEQLSTPGVLTMEPQGDPVRDLVYRYMGEQEAFRRHVLTADSVSPDSEGLQKLVVDTVNVHVY